MICCMHDLIQLVVYRTEFGKTGAHAHGIVSKTVHKTLAGSLLCPSKTGSFRDISSHISPKCTEVVYYLHGMHPLAFLVSTLSTGQDFRPNSGEPCLIHSSLRRTPGVRRPIQGDHLVYTEYVPTLGSVVFRAKASSRQNVAICIAWLITTNQWVNKYHVTSWHISNSVYCRMAKKQHLFVLYRINSV